MWFRRDNKNRNRRIGREHVLDVKLRSDQVHAARVRVFTILGCILFGTFFGIYLIWRTGEVLLDKFVYENPDFAILNIEIHTDGVLSTPQLRGNSNVRIGANLMRLDLAEVERNLELDSAVETASVERVLPHTLRIFVTERSPVAQVNTPCVDKDGNFSFAITQLDKKGVAMKPRDPRQCMVPMAELNPQLPVIIGLNAAKLKQGDNVPAEDLARAQAALGLVSAFSHSPMAGLVDMRSVDISTPGVLVVTTGQGGQITFATDNFDRQLARWRKIFDLGVSQQRSIASADLAVENNIPVRWLNGGPPPVAPKLKNSNPKTRRNNV
jgi:cell division septal protein FtsQ